MGRGGKLLHNAGVERGCSPPISHIGRGFTALTQDPWGKEGGPYRWQVTECESRKGAGDKPPCGVPTQGLASGKTLSAEVMAQGPLTTGKLNPVLHLHLSTCQQLLLEVRYLEVRNL